MSLTLTAFGIGVLAATGIVAMLVVTLATDRRLWPPGERSAAYYGHWSLVWIFNGALVATAYLDWNEWVLPRPSSFVAGAVLAGVGAAIFVRSAGVMDSAETMGVTGDLYTDGPYAYSRNPQYVGMIVGIAGFALLVDSRYVAGLAAAHVAWVLLLPRAEEPHLRAEFGEAYERYAERVPRFVGRRTLRRLRSQAST
ncbi:isoprenylcysteine carboxylmethyltransferase family protein [Natronomonas salina]|uniref:methyltransferase family protein n=1 Tax=Natronomonas salina TaxID=1710540 RepID=UPI0015B5479D|nr:isoprenylcysteine carboxylmethyltransferase family protein [Natronomonas salina]QLD90197.1 isoprenylcysteine carboxylmethyltransferase family protein [Natronomonas salina]